MRTVYKAKGLRHEIVAHLEFEFLLYEVTSTYFEGKVEGNPKAQRGYSRDQRSDCKKVNICLVVTPVGLPIGYEVFAGNTADVSTDEDMVEMMENKYGQARTKKYPLCAVWMWGCRSNLRAKPGPQTAAEDDSPPRSNGRRTAATPGIKPTQRTENRAKCSANNHPLTLLKPLSHCEPTFETDELGLRGRKQGALAKTRSGLVVARARSEWRAFGFGLGLPG